MVAATAAFAWDDVDAEERRGRLVAALRLEDVFPAVGVDYLYAGRVAVGPFAAADSLAFVLGIGSRFYIFSGYDRGGIKPFLLAEGAYRRRYVVVGSWEGDGAFWPDPPPAGREAHTPAAGDWGGRFSDYYARFAFGLDFRVAGAGFVPYLDVGARREYGTEEEKEVSLAWTMGVRYVW
jgi:hypothetical protein